MFLFKPRPAKLLLFLLAAVGVFWSSERSHRVSSQDAVKPLLPRVNCSGLADGSCAMEEFAKARSAGSLVALPHAAGLNHVLSACARAPPIW